MRITAQVTCLAVGLGLCAGPVVADTITVAADGSAQYTSIQSALNAVSAGDVVLVSPGTYTSNSVTSVVLLSSMDLTIRSTDGAATTIIDGQWNKIGVYVMGSGDEFTFEGFTITRARGMLGGGAHVDGPSPTFKDCIFDTCDALGTGGAVYTTSNPVFENCRFLNCTSGAYGSLNFDFFHAQDAGASITLNGCVICGYDNFQAISYGTLEKDDWTLNWPVCSDCNENDIDDLEEVESGDLTDVDGNGLWDHCEADCDNSGVRDPLEIAAGLVTDLDGNWRPDSCDSDCDGDGLPDAYELEVGLDQDCNGNGIADACDFNEEILTDCDGDGVADDCQENLEDCDGDGEIDICQMADGGDCNENDLLDICEVFDGDKEDIDGNGFPDECDCLADIDNSGWVFYDEVVNVVYRFGDTDSIADVDYSGVVDIRDLIYVLEHWGECPYDDPPSDDDP